MNCPHIGKEFPPCQITQHPDQKKAHVNYCKACAQSYDVREIGEESDRSPFIIIATIGLLIFCATIISNPAPYPDAPRIENSYSK